MGGARGLEGEQQALFPASRRPCGDDTGRSARWASAGVPPRAPLTAHCSAWAGARPSPRPGPGLGAPGCGGSRVRFQPLVTAWEHRPSGKAADTRRPPAVGAGGAGGARRPLAGAEGSRGASGCARTTLGWERPRGACVCEVEAAEYSWPGLRGGHRRCCPHFWGSSPKAASRAKGLHLSQAQQWKPTPMLMV